MKKLVLSIAAFLMVIGIATAQDNSTASHNVGITVPAFSLIDIEGPSNNVNISLDIVAPTEAGNELVVPTANSDLYLNYTSVILGTQTRNISVSVTNLPEAFELQVSASAVTTGKGNKGTPVGTAVILSGSSQNLITGIGSCYTVSGHGNGSQLTYSLSVVADNFDQIASDSYTATVTYTITE